MTAAEYREREERKPINAKSQLKNLIYRKMLIDENADNADQDIYSQDRITKALSKIKTDDLESLVENSRCITVDEWIRTNYKYIDTAESLAQLLLYVEDIAFNYTDEKKPVPEIHQAEIGLMCGDYVYRVQRTVREINAYNAIIDIICTGIRMPELCVFKWNLSELVKKIEIHNGVIKEFREKIDPCVCAELADLIKYIVIPVIPKRSIAVAKATYNEGQKGLNAKILDVIRDYLISSQGES